MARFLTRADMSAKLAEYIQKEYGKPAVAARCWGLTDAAVSYYLSGDRSIPERIIEEMGYTKETVFRKKNGVSSNAKKY